MTKRLASLRSGARAGALPALRAALTRVRRLSRRVRVVGEAGMTTAEYAIGTLAACGFAALLVTILRGGVVQGLLLGIIKRALALGG
jgi:hypothetical protein